MVKAVDLPDGDDTLSLANIASRKKSLRAAR